MQQPPETPPELPATQWTNPGQLPEFPGLITGIRLDPELSRRPTRVSLAKALTQLELVDTMSYLTEIERLRNEAPSAGKQLVDDMHRIVEYAANARDALRRTLAGWDRLVAVAKDATEYAESSKRAHQTLVAWHTAQLKWYKELHKRYDAAVGRDKHTIGALSVPEVVSRLEDDMLKQVSDLRRACELEHSRRVEDLKATDDLHLAQRKIGEAERRIMDLEGKLAASMEGREKAQDKVDRLVERNRELQQKVWELTRTVADKNNASPDLLQQVRLLADDNKALHDRFRLYTHDMRREISSLRSGLDEFHEHKRQRTE